MYENEKDRVRLLERIAETAERVRALQKIYFKTRDKSDLILSREAERALDLLLRQRANYEQLL